MTVLQQAHDELETSVQKRTAELAMSTEELKQEIIWLSGERDRLFFDSIPDGVIVLDTKEIIEDCNRSTTLLCKRPREELIGRHITEFLAPASVSTCKRDFPRVQQGETVDGEIQIVRDDTSTLIVSDKGIGLPEDLDFRNTESLGLQVVVALVEQLKGTIELDRSEGTAFKIVFEKSK